MSLPWGMGDASLPVKGETDRAVAALEEPVKSPELLRASKVRKLVDSACLKSAEWPLER